MKLTINGIIGLCLFAALLAAIGYHKNTQFDKDEFILLVLNDEDNDYRVVEKSILSEPANHRRDEKLELLSGHLFGIGQKKRAVNLLSHMSSIRLRKTIIEQYLFLDQLQK